MARMKSVLWIVIVVFAGRCCAQSACVPGAIPAAGARVQAVVAELRKNQLAQDAMETNVPQEIAEQMTRLKEVLSVASDAVLACEKPSVETGQLRKNLNRTLHANGSVGDMTDSIPIGGRGSGEEAGSYGHNLRVGVSRPAGVTGLLEVEFSINIECGDDTMLLVYEMQDGHWKQRLRWQSPPLMEISDAFGDFFMSAIVATPAGSGKEDSPWRLVVAHGTPWCTSRWSNFKMDVLEPGSSPASPRVDWHMNRSFSRGDFPTRLKAFGNGFELRLNTMCLDPDCYERHVIYRYRLEANGVVHRVGPIATNSRGFVEEWLSAPWEELSEVTAAEGASDLQAVHESFEHWKKSDSEFVSHRYGPVRACANAGVFQVEINSKLDTIDPGKPGGDSKPLPSRYFHVREGKDGYVMVSAPTESDPTCTGPDLMPLNPEGSN
jgi:hypothetical protein